ASAGAEVSPAPAEEVQAAGGSPAGPEAASAGAEVSPAPAEEVPAAGGSPAGPEAASDTGSPAAAGSVSDGAGLTWPEAGPGSPQAAPAVRLEEEAAEPGAAPAGRPAPAEASGPAPASPEAASSDPQVSPPAAAPPVRKAAGRIGRLSGAYNKNGQYQLNLEFTGKIGRWQFNTEDLGNRKVTFVDLRGDFDFAGDSLSVSQGPARLFRLGRHEGFVRVSLNYRTGLFPDKVKVSVRQEKGRLVIIYTFDSGKKS
ncbi:MAG: hypothetical protein LBK52_01425, partial [Deltaproteobacteria bacterium]|nr:hypothetical protein [Deltaproteobacteria bacterium]